jgi:hypothetical protein
MKVLHLTLKKKWFDMIASGEKKEEYREIKPYWAKILCDRHVGAIGGDLMDSHKTIAYTFKKFDAVKFASGGHFHPSIQQMSIECTGIEITTGNPEWGAEPGKKYFVIKLGKIISKSNTDKPTNQVK